MLSPTFVRCKSEKLALPLANFLSDIGSVLSRRILLRFQLVEPERLPLFLLLNCTAVSHQPRPRSVQC